MLENTLYFTEDGNEVVLKPGDWYIQLPGLWQEGKFPSPAARYFYIHFKGHSVPVSKNGAFTLGSIKKSGTLSLPVRGRYEPEEYREIFNRMQAIRADVNSTLSEQAAFLEILEKLARTVCAQETKTATLASCMQKYLLENFQNDIAVTSLNRVFSYSSDYLTKVFKTEYGVTPSHYIKRLRIGKAKDLLSHTDKTVSEIAAVSGYNDETVFFRAFKQQTGLSPGTWRKIHRFS